MPTTNNIEAIKKNSLLGKAVIVLGLALIVGGAYSYLASTGSTPQSQTSVQPAETDLITAPAEAAPVTAPAELSIPPREPVKVIESAEQTEPTIKESSPVKAADTLPSLDNSDSLALTSAHQLSSVPTYQSLFIPENIIRNFVVFIDNFSRGELLTNFSPLIKPNERFTVLKVEKQMYLNPKSYQRYNRYADIIAAIDVDFALRQYRTLKPLFSQAYQEIGYSELSFIDTLDDAIEEVLDTPVITKPIALVAPSAMYKFADPQLEALSDTQKLIIRMGPDNTLKLKDKLQQIQQALRAL